MRVACWIVASLASVSSAQTTTPKYAFAPGETVAYDLSVKSEFPGETRTTFYYLVLRPKSVDASGQTTFSYQLRVARSRTTSERGQSNDFVSGTPALVFAPLKEGETGGAELVIDAAGKLVRPEGATNEAQLDSMQGAAWAVALPPLPPAGQNAWATHRPVHLTRIEKSNNNGWGGPQQQTRVESPAEESVSYTVAGAAGGDLTVRRHYTLASLEKLGDTPIDQMTGDGQYVFDTAAGRVRSAEWKSVDVTTATNVTLRVPVTTTARLMSKEEIAKLVSDAKAAEAKFKAEHANDADGDALPGDVVATDVLGTSKGGGPFASVSPDRRPVIGFRVQTASFGGRPCFRKFDPLYEKPAEPAEKDETIVLAREGYAVGAVTVNAGEFFNAACVTFMKKTENGLDPKAVYASPWLGKRTGPTTKKLGGDGRFVLGTVGRKGLNVDTFGLLVAAPAGDPDPTRAATPAAATAKPAR